MLIGPLGSVLEFLKYNLSHFGTQNRKGSQLGRAKKVWHPLMQKLVS